MVQIHWTHMDDIDPALREAAEKRLVELAERRDDVIEVRIVGAKTQHHRHGGREVRIRCLARGQEIVATRERDEAGLALREVLDAFEQELDRLRERRTDRRARDVSLPAHLGLVDRIFPEDGYGFVLTDSGDQVYFHRNAVRGNLSFEALDEGQRVGLNIEQGREGPQATVVIDVPPDTPSP